MQGAVQVQVLVQVLVQRQVLTLAVKRQICVYERTQARAPHGTLHVVHAGRCTVHCTARAK